MARPYGARGIHYVTPLMLDTVRHYLSEDIYRVTVSGRFNARPGALLFLADPDSPTCPVCDGRVRTSDLGRFLYYRRSTPIPRVRFAHDQCLRSLTYESNTDEGMGASWIPNYSELGSVF